jgi:hypothetical protein
LPKLPEVVSYGGWDYTLINCGGFYGGLFWVGSYLPEADRIGVKL